MAAVLLGAVGGAALAGAGAARTIESLRLARDAAVQELGQLRRELEQARSREGTRGARIGAVDLVVEHGDPRVALEVERRLTAQLQPLQGRPVADLHPISLYAGVQGQLVSVDGILYRLRLLGAVVSTRLWLYVRVDPVPTK